MPVPETALTRARPGHPRSASDGEPTGPWPDPNVGERSRPMSEETTLEAALDDLVIANRILANEGVIDAFGHVSIRDPRRPDRYFLARSRSPELVERGDIMEFD